MGPLLVSATKMELYMLNRRVLYKCCIAVLNKRVLRDLKDTVWRTKLNVVDDCKPVWRVFYKAPLNKRSGGL